MIEPSVNQLLIIYVHHSQLDRPSVLHHFTLRHAVPVGAVEAQGRSVARALGELQVGGRATPVRCWEWG